MNDQQQRIQDTGRWDARSDYAPRTGLCHNDPALIRAYLTGYQAGRRERWQPTYDMEPLFDEPGYEESRRPFYS